MKILGPSRYDFLLLIYNGYVATNINAIIISAVVTDDTYFHDLFFSVECLKSCIRWYYSNTGLQNSSIIQTG